ncbi:MAG: Transposase [Bacteroidota bacterium]
MDYFVVGIGIIQEVLEIIPIVKRTIVKEITMDMAPNMALAARNNFGNSKQVIDRFHVVRLGVRLFLKNKINSADKFFVLSIANFI